MDIKKHVQDNPKSYLATILTFFTVIGMSYAAINLFVQENAWSSDIIDLKVLIYDANRSRIEDKIFLLEYKQNEGIATSLDKAELSRYKSRLIKLDKIGFK